MDHPPYLTLVAPHVKAFRRVPPLFPVCFSLFSLFPGWVGPLLSFTQLLICTPDSRLQSINSPAFCHKSSTIINRLLSPCLWWSLAPLTAVCLCCGGSVCVCSSQQKHWSSQLGRKSWLSGMGDDGWASRGFWWYWGFSDSDASTERI